jgi:phosphate transport system substrate-binding protein
MQIQVPISAGTPLGFGGDERPRCARNRVLLIISLLASLMAAGAATATDMPDDFRTAITNAADPDAYPISSFTWLLVPERIEDRTKRQAITGFLRWVLTDGQKLAAPLHYAPLPGDVVSRVLKAVDRIQ